MEWTDKLPYHKIFWPLISNHSFPIFFRFCLSIILRTDFTVYQYRRRSINILNFQHRQPHKEKKITPFNNTSCTFLPSVSPPISRPEKTLLGGGDSRLRQRWPGDSELVLRGFLTDGIRLLQGQRTCLSRVNLYGLRAKQLVESSSLHEARFYLPFFPAKLDYVNNFEVLSCLTLLSLFFIVFSVMDIAFLLAMKKLINLIKIIPFVTENKCCKCQ